MLAFSAANWTTANYVLDAGQEGFETDTGNRKVGDGVTPWKTLPYNLKPSLYPTLPTPQSTLNGTTTGTAISSQPFASSSYKKFLVFLNAYENTTATAQTITFPTPFVQVPVLTHDDSGGSTATVTTLTLPASMSATKTGWIIVEGY